MVNLDQCQQQPTPMGQKSSQVDPFRDPEPDGEELSTKPVKSQHTRHKGKENSVGSEGQDEESARALLQLREGVGNNARLMSSNDDDFAASAQLWAESSPARAFTSFEIENGVSKDLKGVNGHLQEEKRRHKKRKRQDQRAFPEEIDNSYDELDDIDRRPSKQSKHNVTAELPDGGPSLAQTTFSLDDIPTDDETIAAFFQEYENDFTNSTLPNSAQVEAIESDSQMQRLAAIVDREGFDLPLQSTYQLPASSSAPSKHEKAERKRKSRSDPILETNNDNGQEQTNGTGQHDFGIDFAAFDEYFNIHQDGSANISNQHTDYEFPIDPDLIRDSQILKPAKENAGADLDNPCKPQSKAKKLKSVSSLAQRGKPAVNPSIVNRDNTSDDQTEDIGVDHQDEVLPGIEDLPTGSSPEENSLRVSSSPPEPHTYSNDNAQRPKTPPALAKPSKPRGNKTQQGGTKGKNYDPPLEKIAQKGGVYTEREISKLDVFRDAYCLENDVTERQFNELVQSAARGSQDARYFWNQIHELLPYRTRMSTQRFCKRRYHNYSARGTWTQSEDESLKQAVAEKGMSWKAVGEIIERFPEDCRDRYRNYHINAENRNRDQWTVAEVKNLCRAVYSCMQATKEERERDRKEKYGGREVPDSEPESDEEIRDMKLINWQAVSDRMGPAGGGRSRLQCSFKWSHLKMADIRRHWKEFKLVTQGEQRKKSGSAEKTKPWRLNRALKKLGNLKVGDRYDFLQAFATCGAEIEGNIPWKVLGSEEFRSRWTTIERKAALEKFKREVSWTEKSDYRDLVNRLLTQLMAASVDKLDERWNPARDGDVSLPKRSKLTEEQRQLRWEHRLEEFERRSGIKSSRFINSHDEDQQGSSARVVEETSEEETANHSNLASNDDAHKRSPDEVESASPDVLAGNENESASPDVPVDSETEDSTNELFIGSDIDASEDLADKLTFIGDS